jgi:hypothetical protein
MAVDYAQEAAHYLRWANCAGSDEGYRRRMEIASGFERLAAIERGLLPADLAGDPSQEDQA